MIRRLPFLFGLLGLVAGCQKQAVQPAPTKPPEVWVDRPTLREVQVAEEFPGRIEAAKSVEIRAQVTGALETIHFEDGPKG